MLKHIAHLLSISKQNFVLHAFYIIEPLQTIYQFQKHKLPLLKRLLSATIDVESMQIESMHIEYEYANGEHIY